MGTYEMRLDRIKAFWRERSLILNLAATDKSLSSIDSQLTWIQD